jgi:hypothetical protein
VIDWAARRLDYGVSGRNAADADRSSDWVEDFVHDYRVLDTSPNAGIEVVLPESKKPAVREAPRWRRGLL